MPFGGGGFDLAQLMRMLQSRGADQLGDRAPDRGVGRVERRDPSRPIDAAAHEQLDELARAAQTHVVAETARRPRSWRRSARSAARVGPHSISTRCVRCSRRWRATLGQAIAGTEARAGRARIRRAGGTRRPRSRCPSGPSMLGGMMQMLAPVLLGVQAGSMIGYLAQHALGAVRPAPPDARRSRASASSCRTSTRSRRRGRSNAHDLRFYVAVHEVVHAAERSVPWVRDRLVRSSTEYVSAYEVDPQRARGPVRAIDPTDPSSLAVDRRGPEALLGAMQLAAPGRDPRRQLQLLTAVLEGYADSCSSGVGERLIPSFRQIHEAMQRHRVERGEAGRFIEGLLGLQLERHALRAGRRRSAAA